jgi:replicative DNA helicase
LKLIPKQAIEAERAVLAAVLVNSDAMRRIDLQADDFYKPSHREMYVAMRALTGEGNPVDGVTLADKLPKYKQEIMDILSEAITTANIKYHAEIVSEASRLRKLQRLFLQGLDAIGGDAVEKSDVIIGRLHSDMAGIMRNQGDTITDMREVALEAFDYIERRHKHKGVISGIPSGFPDIDKITDGFQPGDLIVIGARPSMGKTAFAMAVTHHAADKGFPVGVVSLEMGPLPIGIRSVASLSGVELFRLQKGILSREGWNAITGAAGRMANLPIYFSFSALELDQLQKVITQMVEVKGVKMVVVDYLQLAKNIRQKVREREVGEISTTLKHLAKTFTIPVIALSQLNRKVEERQDKRPKLSDLRDSGQIDQDADVVMFLHREKPKESRGTVEVHFAKGRNIGLGMVRLHFDGNTMTFRQGIREEGRKEA